MLAVHGRTRKQLYRGDADWSVAEELAKELNIPIVGSGDVIDLGSAKDAISRGVAGLMIGRGALSNPWIFGDIALGVSGKPVPKRADHVIADVLEMYLELLLEQMPEKGAIGRMKQLASHATRRVHGASLVRRELCTAKSLEQFCAVLRDWRDYLKQREHEFTPGSLQQKSHGLAA